MTSGEALAVLLGGILARFALLLILAGMIAVPLFLIVAAVTGYRQLVDRGRANGLLWSPALYYAPGHTWIRTIGSGALRIGVDALAGRLLGGTGRVELTRPGSAVGAGAVLGVITCGDKRAEIRSPVAGTVTAVNETVMSDPSLVHREPYGTGWLCTVTPSDDRYRRFFRGERARVWLGEEGVRLARFLERDLGVAAADGGDPMLPTPALLTDEQWRALTAAFLGTGTT